MNNDVISDVNSTDIFINELHPREMANSEKAQENVKELAEKLGYMAYCNPIGLPDGELKTEQIKKKKKAELQQFLLTDKQHDYGVVALLAKELDLARLEKDIEATANFIAVIEVHKATLP